MYGTSDFNQGYIDGFNGTKTCLDGRAQFDSKARKYDYTDGHRAGRIAKNNKEWSNLTPAQAKAKAERETNQVIARDYGFSDDAIKALDTINIATGRQFPVEG